MNDIFYNFSIKEIKDKFISGQLSPTMVAGEVLNKIDTLENKYKAWVCFDKELLLNQARAAEVRLKNGSLKLLEGIPVGVKDIFNTAEFPTQMGSPLWKGFAPGNDARAVFNIKREGAIIPGKTVTAEFAVHALNETLNPHDITKTPGTSSSGSAVAVALGMVPAALGTQTAGSIIRPASFCGVYGCKPSFGLIPRTGILKTTDTLDTVGFFTAKPNDLRLIFDAIRVKGNNYPLSHKDLNQTERQCKPADKSWKIAFVKTHTWADASSYAQGALENFISELNKIPGIRIEEVDLPEIVKKSHQVHEIIYDKSLVYYFKEEYKNKNLISPTMNAMIENGLKVSQEEFYEALAGQEAIQATMDRFFEDYDIIISLSTAGEAPLRNETEKPDPALIWTLAHLPAVSVPKFLSPNKLPFGFQLVARKYNDYLLFEFLNFLISKKLIPDGQHPKIFS